MRSALALLSCLAVCSCGGSAIVQSGGAGAAGADAAIDAVDSGVGDGEATDGGNGGFDAISEAPIDSALDGASDSAGPATCDDVGKFPGYATCCDGEYCAGACFPKSGGGERCECADFDGCPWPLVCCAVPSGCYAYSICEEW